MYSRHHCIYPFGVGCISQNIYLLPIYIHWTGLTSCRCTSHLLWWEPHSLSWLIHWIYKCWSLPWWFRYVYWTGSTSSCSLWPWCLLWSQGVVVWRRYIHRYYFLCDTFYSWWWSFQFLTQWVSSSDSVKLFNILSLDFICINIGGWM